MIENYLIQIGMRGGSVKNFGLAIVEDSKKFDNQHWYFLTPIKVKDNGNGLKEATINLAYPFEVERDDVSEVEVLERLSGYMIDYETELLKQLRKILIVPSLTLSVVPFWANEKGERVERKNFAQAAVHILSATATVKYREHWI